MTEQEYRDEIARLRDKRHQGITLGTITVREERELHLTIQRLSLELMDLLRDGAKNCPVCEQRPHALLRTPSYEKDDGTEMAPIYEIGCIHCWRSARSWTIELTKAKWNAERFIKEPSEEKKQEVAFPLPLPPEEEVQE
jgi:hypothetical protein